MTSWTRKTLTRIYHSMTMKKIVFSFSSSSCFYLVLPRSSDSFITEGSFSICFVDTSSTIVGVLADSDISAWLVSSDTSAILTSRNELGLDCVQPLVYRLRPYNSIMSSSDFESSKIQFCFYTKIPKLRDIIKFRDNPLICYNIFSDYKGAFISRQKIETLDYPTRPRSSREQWIIWLFCKLLYSSCASQI